MKNILFYIALFIFYPLLSQSQVSTKLLNHIEKYKFRYPSQDLLNKITDNFGNGYDALYGTRNMRPVLFGFAYRGGANNYYHQFNKRKNQNPLPNDGLMNLCEEGFQNAIYLYQTNFDTTSITNCNCNNYNSQIYYQQLDYFDPNHIYQILKLVHSQMQSDNPSPIYFHCWNGWHATGFISAIMLKQFCGYSDIEAINYWDLGTDGANKSPHYRSIRNQIRDFKPYSEFIIHDSLGNKICPPLPKIIDSSKLHIEVEHLLIVPEAIPLNNSFTLYNVKFQPGATSIPLAHKNPDLATLLSALQKHKDLKVEIQGHTDRSGNEISNQKIASARAKFVYDFLLKNNIASERLIYKGYGSTLPKFSNKSKTGRANNRRIDIKVLEKYQHGNGKLVNEGYHKEEN